MDRKSISRTATYAAPFFALVISAGAIAFENRNLANLQTEFAATRQEVNSARSLITEMEGQKSLSRYATAALSPVEQPSFLNSLRAYADLNHVELVRWTMAPPPGPHDPVLKALPPDVTPLTSAIEVDGRYGDLRSFLYDLLKSPRLVNMTEMRWARGGRGRTEMLSFNVTRYVVPLGKDSASVARATAGAAGQSGNGSGGSQPKLPFNQGVLGKPNPNAEAAVQQLEHAATPAPERR